MAICASTGFTMAPPEAAATAMPPAAKPDRLRNVRRSTAPPVKPVRTFDNRAPFAAPLVFFINMLKISLDLGCGN